MRWPFSFLPGTFLAIHAAVALCQSHTNTQRLFRVDDLFELEQMGDDYGGPYVFSPDGRSLALVRIRPTKTLSNYTWEFLRHNAGADVWLLKPGSSIPLNVTNGAADGSGWFSPQWSPNGKHLAMLSTRGGNLHLWVLDPESLQLKQVSPHSIDLADSRGVSFLWIDSERLVVPVLADDAELPLEMRLDVEMPTVGAMQGPKMRAGAVTTPSVLDSRIPANLDDRPKSRLLLLSIAGGTEKVVAEGHTSNWQISPDRALLAFNLKTGIRVPENNHPLPSFATEISNIQLARSDGSPVELHGRLPSDVFPGSLRWSPDGRELSFMGYDQAGKTGRIYRLDVKHSTTRLQSTAGESVGSLSDTPGLQYLPPHTLVFRTKRTVDPENSEVTSRWDWWLSGSSERRCVTCQMTASPEDLVAVGNGESLIGVANDHVWALDTHAHARDLTAR